MVSKAADRSRRVRATHSHWLCYCGLSLGPTWSVGPIWVWLVCCSSSRIQNVFSNLCSGPSALNFAEIPMIFCRHISWAVPECSAKFGLNCWRFQCAKNDIFAHFSNSILAIPMIIHRDIAGGKGHLVYEFDIKGSWPRGKWWPF